VDDSPLNRTVLRRMLQAAGVTEIVEAGDGRDALDAYLSSPFQLVLLDLVMPRMDGWQTCERIRAIESASCLHSGGPAAYIAAITSEDISEGSLALQRCWDVGMNAVLVSTIILSGELHACVCRHEHRRHPASLMAAPPMARLLTQGPHTPCCCRARQ
jgi:CheY-like chemotaxis protein